MKIIVRPWLIELRTFMGVDAAAETPASPEFHVDIFATGLRNAYGLTFDSAGQLWAANNGHSTDGSFPNTASQCEGFITATEAELQVRSPRHRRPSCCKLTDLTEPQP